MKRHTASECTVEAFDDWAAASDRFDAVGQAADEVDRTDIPMATTNIGTIRAGARRAA